MHRGIVDCTGGTGLQALRKSGREEGRVLNDVRQEGWNGGHCCWASYRLHHAALMRFSYAVPQEGLVPMHVLSTSAARFSVENVLNQKMRAPQSAFRLVPQRDTRTFRKTGPLTCLTLCDFQTVPVWCLVAGPNHRETFCSCLDCPRTVEGRFVALGGSLSSTASVRCHPQKVLQASGARGLGALDAPRLRGGTVERSRLPETGLHVPLRPQPAQRRRCVLDGGQTTCPPSLPCPPSACVSARLAVPRQAVCAVQVAVACCRQTHRHHCKAPPPLQCLTLLLPQASASWR